MSKILQCSLILLILFTINKGQTRTAADVIFYHYRTGLDDKKIDHFELFPQEKEIKNFPAPLSQNETDLNILQKYYKNIALAYRKYLEKNYQVKKVESFRKKEEFYLQLSETSKVLYQGKLY